MDLEHNLWMPLATERELCFGCSSEGEGWVLSRQEGKKRLIAFRLTNNYIDLLCDASWAFMFGSDVITSDQRPTVFSLSCIRTLMARQHCGHISQLPVTEHLPPCLIEHSSPSKLLQKGRSSPLTEETPHELQECFLVAHGPCPGDGTEQAMPLSAVSLLPFVW